MEKLLSKYTGIHQVELPTFVFRDNEGFYNIYCPALEFSSYGVTGEEAINMFKESVQILIESLNNKGVLEQELKQLGWAANKAPSSVKNLHPPVIQEKQVIQSINTKNYNLVNQIIALPY